VITWFLGLIRGVWITHRNLQSYRRDVGKVQRRVESDILRLGWRERSVATTKIDQRRPWQRRRESCGHRSRHVESLANIRYGTASLTQHRTTANGQCTVMLWHLPAQRSHGVARSSVKAIFCRYAHTPWAGDSTAPWYLVCRPGLLCDVNALVDTLRSTDDWIPTALCMVDRRTVSLFMSRTKIQWNCSLDCYDVFTREAICKQRYWYRGIPPNSLRNGGKTAKDNVEIISPPGTASL